MRIRVLSRPGCLLPFLEEKIQLPSKNLPGIYRYYGLVMFTENISTKEVKYWLNKFKKIVNKAAGNELLQFTAEIWIYRK